MINSDANTASFILSITFIAVGGISAWFSVMRSSAVPRSHPWFGGLAAPIIFAIASRKAFGLGGSATLVLILVGFACNYLGNRLGRTGFGPLSSLRWRIAVYATLAAAAILMLSGGPAFSQAVSGRDYNRLEANEPAPDFALTDQDGRKTRLADFRGNVTVVTFFYSTCTDICPTILATLESVEAVLQPKESEQVRFVAVSIDAGRDTVERLKEFMIQRGLNAKNWRLLTGSILDLTAVANDYGVVVRPGAGEDLVHNGAYILIDRKGNDRVEFHGSATPAEALASDIRILLAEKASGSAWKPGELLAAIKAWLK